MKTEIHMIDGCDLDLIEQMASQIDYRVPNWVPYIVAIPGTETSKLDEMMVNTLHFSGLLRQCSHFGEIEDGQIDDEDGKSHHVADLLDDAAERLDQAHQEWLDHETRPDLLNNDERDLLSMILETYCEDCDSDEETGKEVDALWNKIKGARA